MHLYETPGEVEPEPRTLEMPGRSGVQLLETTEEAGQALRWYPDAPVPNSDLEAVRGLGLDPNLDPPPGVGELDRVGDEIQHDFLEPEPVEGNRSEPRVNERLNLMAPLVQTSPQAGHDLGDY